MAELECLLDAAVEKLLQNSGTEVGPGLSVQALQEENARLKAQLAEVQKVDDEEINRLWSLVGDMKHAWDSRALASGPNDDIRSGFASVMGAWHEHGQLTAELGTLRAELAAHRKKTEQIVSLLETLTSSSKQELLPKAVVEASQKQELVVDHHAIAASVVEMLQPALATIVGGLVEQAVGTSRKEDDKEAQARPLPIEPGATREVATQTTEPTPSTAVAGEDDAKQTKAKERVQAPPSEGPAQERKGEHRDPRISSKSEATGPPAKPREERMTSRSSTRDSQRRAPSDSGGLAREQDGRASRSSRQPDESSHTRSQATGDPRRTTTTRRDRDDSRRTSPERSSPQKRARSADPGPNSESPAAKVARPASAQEREIGSRSRQGSSRPGTPDHPGRDDREQRRKDELSATKAESSRLPPTTRTVRAEDIPRADVVRLQEALDQSTEPLIKVSVGGTALGLSTTANLVASEPAAPPPAQQPGATGSIRFRTDDSRINPEPVPATAEEKQERPATISTITHRSDPVDVPAEMYFPVGLLSDKKQLSYKDVKGQVESLMGCPACGWTFTSRDGWAKHQLTAEHKNTVRRLSDPCAKASRGLSNAATHPRNALHACLACENVLQGTQLLSHFMGKKHLDRCKGLVFGRR